jgi:D-glycerate 3-kinase
MEEKPFIPDELIERVLERVLPFIERHKESHAERRSEEPFVLAIGGPQGSGKTTWARCLQQTLTEAHGLKTITVSLDDFYFDHANIVRLREEDLQNPLFRTRGVPGTHDEALAAEFFKSLKSGEGDIVIPSFDKSKFRGEGDRAPQSEWTHVKRDPPVDVLIFEGWCVGFRPLSSKRLQDKWKRAWDEAKSKEEERQKERKMAQKDGRLELPMNTLANHAVWRLQAMNENLRRYCETFMGPANFDYLIHLDTEMLVNIYVWRMQQEHALKKAKGTGMTDEQVVLFVEGYMPSYELYMDDLRSTAFFPKTEGGQEKGQLRLVLDKNRTML